MATLILNGAEYAPVVSKSDFSNLIEKLASKHRGLSESALLYFMRSDSGDDSNVVAAMIDSTPSAAFHLLFEFFARPEISKLGFFEAVIKAEQVEMLISAFGEGDSRGEFLRGARAVNSDVTVGILAKMDSSKKASSDYLKFRTNTIFELFNAGALRGADAAARQALLDSFSYLPNNYLSADGSFLVTKGEGGIALRASEGSKDWPAVCDETSIAGIDKFPSLMSVRAAQLRRDENRIVPSVMIRDGVHVGKRNIFMFHAAVNIAAFIGDDNIIDSHASVGSAAQIGNKNKIGSFVSIEGVLSPANAAPVFIGNENFFGTFARIGTGIILGNKNFIAAGVSISKGTKLKDCRDGSVLIGSYVNVQELNENFNSLAIVPNSAVREFKGVQLVPGEFVLFENTEEFMCSFAGDERIKAAK